MHGIHTRKNKHLFFRIRFPFESRADNLLPQEIIETFPFFSFPSTYHFHRRAGSFAF